ncbi:MAG TPA: hypothetical protein VL486_05490 [Verrucomicrobiae bacterium]|nr:hypothetical protein [Verrucomicrobiae bacterium]
MNGDSVWRAQFERTERLTWMIGLVGLAACAVGAMRNPDRFFEGYLLAYLFWLGLSLGCLAILMIHHLAGGRWGFAVRRLLEAATRTMPLMLVLFIPYLFGLRSLYIWTRPEAVAADPLLQHKQPYLNVPFFLIRAGVYFVVWLGLVALLNRAADRQDRSPGPAATNQVRLASSLGIVAYGLTMSFAAIDWAMSLEPHWFSTVYGVLILAGQVLCGFAFVTVVAALLAGREPLSRVLEPLHFHDLGNFLLTFVIFWAYIAFSQFLIIWSGNLTDENFWYLRRFEHGWGWIGVALVVFHFFVPFFLLLSRDIKRRSPWLAKVAWLILVMGVVDVFWIVAPGFHRTQLAVHWTDGAALVGIGGVWVGMYVRQLRSKSLLPVHDARIEEELESR